MQAAEAWRTVLMRTRSRCATDVHLRLSNACCARLMHTAPLYASYCRRAANDGLCVMQIDALEELGFEPAQIEHICTIAWQLLDFEPAKIKAVAEYVKQQGVDDPKPVLFNNPKLLEYEVQGDELVKGKRARARVTLDKSNGTDSLLVSWYTANTAFAEESAPIAPWRPS